MHGPDAQHFKGFRRKIEAIHPGGCHSRMRLGNFERGGPKQGVAQQFGEMLPLHRAPICAEHSFSVTGVEGIEHPLRGFTPS